ncbi:MAG: hypothetical protein EA387_13805 [Nitriliruptor sp.]|nr:MAG: hypothetical protein EA387_13805 [Nitriliruptor sp.]
MDTGQLLLGEGELVAFAVGDRAGRIVSEQTAAGRQGLVARTQLSLLRQARYGEAQRTRYGWGNVAEKATSLATVLERMLHAPDHGRAFAEWHILLVDRLVGTAAGRCRGQRPVRVSWSTAFSRAASSENLRGMVCPSRQGSAWSV